MATGRTLIKFCRIYYDGYDISAYFRTIGPLGLTFPEVDVSGVIETLKGFLVGQPSVTPGNYTGVFDSTPTSGILAVGNAGNGAGHDVSVVIGIRAAPAAGDPVFCGN